MELLINLVNGTAPKRLSCKLNYRDTQCLSKAPKSVQARKESTNCVKKEKNQQDEKCKKRQ